VAFPDHGRGTGPEWVSHGRKIPHSDEGYFLAIGAGVTVRGEIKGGGQVYQEQYAETIAELLGLKFVAPHAVAPAVRLGESR